MESRPEYSTAKYRGEMEIELKYCETDYKENMETRLEYSMAKYRGEIGEWIEVQYNPVHSRIEGWLWACDGDGEIPGVYWTGEQYKHVQETIVMVIWQCSDDQWNREPLQAILHSWTNYILVNTTSQLY